MSNLYTLILEFNRRLENFKGRNEILRTLKEYQK